MKEKKADTTNRRISLMRISILSLMLVSFVLGKAYDFTDGDFVFRIISETDKTVALMKYNYIKPDRNPDCTCCSGCKGWCTDCIGPDSQDPIIFEIPSTAVNEDKTYTVIEINYWPFADSQQRGIKEVRIPDTVITIGYRAFAGMMFSELETAYIPASVTELDPRAFMSSHFLTNIIIDEANPKYKSRGGMVLDKEGTYLYSWISARGSEVEVPFGIETIGEDAFYGNLEWDRIGCLALPSTLREIGYDAFEDLPLKELRCYAATPPTLAKSVFYNNMRDAEYYPRIVSVPNASVELYKNDPAWKRLADYIYPMNPEEDDTRNNEVTAIPEGEATVFTVYTLDGRFIMQTAEQERIKELDKGVYIINGRKVLKE